ncbi:glycosyltransferase family 2 protein [Parapedobacter koreensis]|uniref:Glycosyltransferase, GT2 family n=1 Tax=Parapedobacter koreensis TaxID=332977 RepID=A0A1H7GC02_9SPHI|nr:glycosyltransferase [Parapedobacter koreensis]SEK35806.1 Glycosyltransferase, GT2 family [Parapedobacter koreensis]
MPDITHSIDIVIPSYRLEKDYILRIIRLSKPEKWVFKYYIVVDNPNVIVDEEIARLAASGDITLLINPVNLGASTSRNKGLEAGSGEWILFLDDDIKADERLLHNYVHAITKWPDEIGFIGLVKLPPPPTAFARALIINGSMMIFGIAEEAESFAWGATANTMVKREAVGAIRFSTDYPKSGGGEDVDFFLNVRDSNGGKDYKTLKEAVVYHPWWNEGRPSFKRSFRYGVGNSYLGQFLPKYTYYDFPNTPEALFLMLLAFPIVIFIAPVYLGSWGQLFIGFGLVEVIATLFQAAKRKAPLSAAVAYYVVRLKLAYETGLLWGNIARFRFAGIGARFEYKGRKHGNGFFQFNTYKIVKWVLYALFIYGVFL